RPPHRERTAEAHRADLVAGGAGRVETRRQPPVDHHRDRVPRSGRHVPRDFLEDALDAAVEIAGGDVQQPHQKIRLPTTTVSPGWTRVDRSFGTLISCGLPPASVRTIFTLLFDARSVKSPALAINCRTVMPEVTSQAPGAFTSPRTNAFPASGTTIESPSCSGNGSAVPISSALRSKRYFVPGTGFFGDTSPAAAQPGRKPALASTLTRVSAPVMR